MHTTLAVISIGFGTAIGRLGWRGLRADREHSQPQPAARTAVVLAAEPPAE